jgi:hypothetical protein
VALQLNVAGEALPQPLDKEALLLQIQLRSSGQVQKGLQDDPVLIGPKTNQCTASGGGSHGYLRKSLSSS